MAERRRLTTLAGHLAPRMGAVASHVASRWAAAPPAIAGASGSHNVAASSDVDVVGRVAADPGAPYDVIVVGAGAVGCPLAVAFAQQGRRVLLVERDLREPDRIVGELLQPGGVAALRELGIDSVLEGIDAVREMGYCVFYQGKPVHLPYPAGHTGASFHHGRLIQQLRAAARRTPNVDLRQGTVTELVHDGDRVVGVVINQPASADGPARRDEVRAPLTCLVDGCHSRFRGEVGGAVPAASSSFVGLVLHMPVERMPMPAHGHVILAQPSPILLYALTPTEIRMLVDVPHPLPPSVDGSLRRYMDTVVLPQLPEEFQAPFAEALDRDRLRSMPNNQMAGRQSVKPGAVLLGDSYNMRHPLTGGGMTVGMRDAVLLARLLRDVPLANAAAVSETLRVFERQRRPLAATVNILAMALYQVFSAGADPSLPHMREACFQYFVRGGECAAGPVRLLAGLAPSYWLLIAHFFAVAFFGVGRLLAPVPTPARIAVATRLVWAATKIIAPLMAAERVTPLQYWPMRSLVQRWAVRAVPASRSA